MVDSGQLADMPVRVGFAVENALNRQRPNETMTERNFGFDERVEEERVRQSNLWDMTNRMTHFTRIILGFNMCKSVVRFVSVCVGKRINFPHSKDVFKELHKDFF